MGTGVSPPPWSPNTRDYTGLSPSPSLSPKGRGDASLASPAAPGAEALDLASFRRRDVVRTASHLAHEALLLHLATELPKRLLELLGILDDNAHNPERIPVARQGRSVKRLLQHVGADGSADGDHRERERE